MLQKDTLRLIKKTFNRFFSLLMIVLIGVAFMMGLLSTRTIMERSVDSYDDAYSLQDVQIYSTYGFDDDDVKALGAQEFVDKYFASKAVDVYSLSEDGASAVIRIEELGRAVNRYELVEGRLPNKRGEALLLNSGLVMETDRIGSKIKLYLEDDEVLDLLEYDEYVITGIVKAPTYMAKTLGTSMLNNLELEAVAFVSADDFKSDYYTTLYFTVPEVGELQSFSSRYSRKMQEVMRDIEVFSNSQQNSIKRKLLAEYTEEISKAELALEEGRAEGQRKLDEARRELDDARIQILATESQLLTWEILLSEATERHEALLKQYAPSGGTASDEIARIEAADADGRSFNEIYAEVTTDYGVYTALKVALDAEVIGVPDSIKERMSEIDSKYGGSVTDTFNRYSELQRNALSERALEEELSAAAKLMATARAEIDSGRSRLESGKVELELGEAEYSKAVTEFNIEIEKAESKIRKAYQDLEELPEAEWIILDRDSHYATYMYKNNSEQMGAIGIALPGLFYLVAALVCMTTMTRLVDEQRSEIGVLRALGFSRAQVIFRYVFYALAATVSGSVLGIILGMAIFPTVIYNTWRLMYDLPDMIMMFPIWNILICLVAFSALMSLVTYLVVRVSLNEMPSQLMRPKAPKNARKVFLEHMTGLWNRMSFTSKITARNIIRYKSRFIMTVIGVAGCAGLLVLGWGIKDSISDVVGIQYGDIFDNNYSVSITEDADLDKMLEVIEQNPDNESFGACLSYSSKAYIGKDEPTINVVVISPRDCGTLFNLRETDEVTPIKLANSGVAVSEKFARNNGIKAGDYITIESKGGIKADARVAVICEMYFQHYLFITPEYYGTLFNEPVRQNLILIKNTAETYAGDGLDEIEGFESLTDFSMLIGQFEDMISALDFIILVIIITAGSLAFVVLINLTQVNISERVREIATLKVLGFRRTEVSSYIFKEIILLSLIGGIVGMPLGVIEHRFIMNVINMDMIMFGDDIKLVSFIYAFALTMVFTAIVLFMTRRPLGKIEMIESLKSVE